MTDNSRDQSWPRNQFHPVYESFAEWLDAEAPARPSIPDTPRRGKRRKRRKAR